MKLFLPKSVLTLLVFLLPYVTFAQQGMVSGVLNDSDGVPLPGVNVLIKGTNKGVVTSFEGEYKILCQVGDVLRFEFIGMLSKEVTVTASMFGTTSSTIAIEKVPVKTIKSEAYKTALLRIKKATVNIPNAGDAQKTYNKERYFQYNRIRDIKVNKDSVQLIYFKPDVYYEIGFKTINGLQFVQNSNVPLLQSTYAQGVPINGEVSFQGAETGVPFSYGPRIQALEFDGSNYNYDLNGRLISKASGIAAKPYDNSILKTTFKSVNNVFFNVSTADVFLGFDFTNKTQKDIFSIATNKYNDLVFKYINKSGYGEKLGWNAFVKYSNHTTNQPNINGFQNNVLLNSWITPASFSNNQGIQLLDNTQRSFSPNQFNNPLWLLQTNHNAEKHTLFVASLKNEYEVSDYISINSKLNYSYTNNTQNFGVIRNTNGFNGGYLSDRSAEKNNFNAALNFNYKQSARDHKIDITSNVDYIYEDLNYSLFQANGFNPFSFSNPENSSLNNRTLNRNILRLMNKVIHKFNNESITTSFTNNSYISSIQNNKWFLPTLELKLDLRALLDAHFLNSLSVSANTSLDVNDSPLLYGNQSHNSLNISPSETLMYRAVNDLFVSNALKLEEKESYNYNLSLGFRAFESDIHLGITHFNNHTKNTVFPVTESNTFQLKNSANVTNKGFEATLEATIRLDYNYDFTYRPSFVFSTYRTKVTKLLDNSNRIPIAGFSTISKNLIEGQPAGVIVGSAYQRDDNNNIIIGDNGFPLVDPELQIIGDPIPKFNLGFKNTLRWKDLRLNFLIDFQKGGDVWNGTQNVLNYFGTSQQSAKERTTSNFVFTGVNQQGIANTTAVDFYNPENSILENRFVRYGFEGVAEDAIVDGSYMNLKSIDLSYDIMNNNNDSFIRTFNVGLYAYNLLTWSKFRGASPYSSLYNNASARGLNFFNAPLVSEVGLTINVKI